MILPPSYYRLKEHTARCFSACMMVLFIWISASTSWAQPEVMNRQISLSRQQTTIYGALNQLSKATGYFFVYDSDLIDNDKRIRITSATSSLRTWLTNILENTTLDYRIIENHILIYQPQEVIHADDSKPENEERLPGHIFLKGRVLDQETGMPLPYASIVIPGKGFGLASNTEGLFHLRISDELIQENIKVSYMGFKSQVLPISLLKGNNVDIILESDYISMQEVIIRHYDPDEIIRRALEKRLENYKNEPVYHVSFYREGVIYNNKLLNYSEAIFRVYKSAYDKPFDNDQVMLLKSRKISNVDFTDTLLMKIKAGVQSALDLDIMKTMPDFLNPEFLHEVDFLHVDLVARDSKMVYAINFEQISPTYLPVYSGIIYIDTESLAILKAEFEVHPKYLKKSEHLFIVKKSRQLNISFDRIRYSINYQYHNGYYHLSHVRGDLEMKVRPRNRLFRRDYHAFLEMAVSHIDEEDVQRFSRREIMKTNTTFADQDFNFDARFWGEYNIIPPEKHLNESLSQIRLKIESIIPDVSLE